MEKDIFRIKIAFFVSLFSINVIAQTVNSTSELARTIDELIQPLETSGYFSGSIFIAQGDDIMYQRSFGFANKEHEVENTMNTRFGIGSITKLMTAIVIEQLVNEGKLDLSSRVNEYIDDFPAGSNGKTPTIEHLVNHTSGIPHRVTNLQDEAQYSSTLDIVNRVKQLPLKFKPGRKRLYSSAGYTVLAHIVEIIEQQSFDQVLKERVFVPAKMKSATSEDTRLPMSMRAYPYYLGTSDAAVTTINAPFKDLSFLTGSASVFATATDLNSFLTAMKTGALAVESRFNQESKSWRGWTGRSSGYEAYLDVLPYRDLRLVILTNLRSAATWQVRDNLRKILSNEMTKPIVRPLHVKEPFESHQSLTGSYNNNGSAFTINIQRGKLYRGDNEFYPVDGNRYYIPASGTIMKFRRNDSDQVDAIIQIRGTRETIIPRIN